VSYIQSKFLLRDPLGLDPIVVTGSANFSPASTNADENMIVIRGDRRVADIYFTEFNRIFNHYYFRSVVEAPRRRDGTIQRGRCCSRRRRPIGWRCTSRQPCFTAATPARFRLPDCW
jgi:phosphatidylserine/phosphatidylglycerophosphate/cardiolipin synthase-like enzyme